MTWKWVAELPSVNFKVVVGCSMFVAFCLAGFACMLRGTEVDEGLLYGVGGTILAFNGVTSLDFRTKRRTYLPAPPVSPDVEDAKAGATVPAGGGLG